MNHILFDLDGTLTDPAEGITNSVAYALSAFGISVPDKKDLIPFIGPPLLNSFREFYGFSREQARKAVQVYREYFSEKGIYENTLYGGVKDMLARLKEAGSILFLATTKPEPYAKRILSHFEIGEYFDFVAGSTLEETRTDKAELIEYAFLNHPVQDRQEAVMVGDRKHDILGAKKAGISSLGVLYGYGGRAELVAAGADRLAGSVSELEKLLLE